MIKIDGLEMEHRNQLTDSNIAIPLAPMFPLGVTPSPPIRPAHRSLEGQTSVFRCYVHLLRHVIYIVVCQTDLRMSPYRLGITRTSN